MRIRFDRGTLVIDRTEQSLDSEQLLGAMWDHELAAWRLPAEKLSELRGRRIEHDFELVGGTAPQIVEVPVSLEPTADAAAQD